MKLDADLPTHQPPTDDEAPPDDGWRDLPPLIRLSVATVPWQRDGLAYVQLAIGAAVVVNVPARELAAFMAAAVAVCRAADATSARRGP